MSFEEEFPSVVKRSMEEYAVVIREFKDLIIRECCVDKQRLREAIDREIETSKRMNNNPPEAEMRLKDLKEELGL